MSGLLNTKAILTWATPLAAAAGLTIAAPTAGAQIGAASYIPPRPGTPGPVIVSPEVGADRKVTFRILAPKATSVTLAGEFVSQANAIQPPAGDLGVGPKPDVTFTKGADGIWTGTTAAAIRPGAYRYYFEVDGVPTLDIRNTRVSPQRLTQNSLLVVPGDYSEARDVPHGTVGFQRYASQIFGGAQRGVWVYTPPGYEKSNKSYPVLYLLHGGGDNEASWVDSARVNDILDNQIAAGKVRPFIVVMPQHLMTPSNQREDAQTFLKEFGSELMPWVERTYRVVATSEGRAIAGLSAGGRQTINISMHRPELFRYVGVFSGAASNDPANLYSDTKANFAKTRNWKVHYWAWGAVDFLQPAITTTVKYLKDNRVRLTTAKETAGGHDWRVWRDYMEEFAPQLFK